MNKGERFEIALVKLGRTELLFLAAEALNKQLDIW